MTNYYVEAFGAELEIPDDHSLVAAELSTAGDRRTRNFALIEEPSEGVTEYECGARTAAGFCGREVDGPEENCWQHDGSHE